MTGRGQVAQLAYEDGWEITLVDRNEELVSLLRREGRYTVRLIGPHPREVIIQGFEVLHTGESSAIAGAVTRADLVVTSVLEPNLPNVARILEAALLARLRAGVNRPLNIIAAENMAHSSTILGGYVRQFLPNDLAPTAGRMVGFPDSMIARVVPVAEDPLVIHAEEYSEWTADKGAVVGEPPQLAGLEWITNQTARLQRKLYIHNTGHAVCGYLGWLARYRYIHEAAQNPEIMSRISQAISESGRAVAREHGFDPEEVTAYENDLKARLVISELPDDIRRVIRQPIRKLGREERFLGPLRLCEKYRLPSAALCYGIAAVMACRMPGDEQFDRIAQTMQWLGPVEALQILVSHRPGDRAASQIAAAYQEIIQRYRP